MKAFLAHARKTIPDYDVIVIGAGPAGAEAALGAGRSGARTLCLTINLDTAGFPPATPVLVDDGGDVRGVMLSEMEEMGAALPDLLRREGVVSERGSGSGFEGRLVVDRRNLGLSWKQELECSRNIEMRQALVTAIEPESPGGTREAGWRVATKLGEKFDCAAVVVAAGTFLKGVVEDAGDLSQGGRLGEIPSNALALWLENLGIRTIEVHATGNPRVDSRGLDPHCDSLAAPWDGEQLKERLARGLAPAGNRARQMHEVRRSAGFACAWMTRASFRVFHRVLVAGEVGVNLESMRHPGLFFAGRVSGSCNYIEAAALGAVAGRNAAKRVNLVETSEDYVLIDSNNYVYKLCEAVASGECRPVTVRAAGPGC